MTTPFRLIAALCMAALPTVAAAQNVQSCEGRVDVTQIVEPWEIRSRPFAEGAIRIFEVFVDPNVASGAFIGVLHPTGGEPPYDLYRTCTAVFSNRTTNGMFAEAYIENATATYDPATGLAITVPIRLLGGAEDIEDEIVITVNQATGVVTARSGG